MAQRCTDAASHHLYGEALNTAVANRNLNILEALLERNFEFDLEELTKNLNSVCAWGNEEALQILLKHDAKQILGVQQYSSSLIQAARKNNRQIVMYWLNQHPERLNLVVDPAILIDVSGNGFMDVLLPLIENIRPADSFEMTLNQCLRVASENGHKEVVEYLIGEGADVNSIEQEPLYTSDDIHPDQDYFDVNSIEQESLCTSDDTHPDQDYFDRLFYDSNRLARKLTALQAALIGFERFGPNTENTPLQQLRSSWKKADASSQQEVIEVLLEKGADPNRGDEYEGYPLNVAAKHCTVEIVQKLISSGAKVGAVAKEHGTALQAAARREIGGLPVIKTLLEADAPISSIDPGKAVALNEALSFFEISGWFEQLYTSRFVQSTSVTDVLNTGPGAVVKLLLANLPDMKADDSRYGLLAQMACMAGDQECVELLLQRGMDVNISGSYYGTALQAACRVGNIKIVERLLNSGANINVLQGVYGTALRAAVIGGHEDLVGILITRGADVNLRYQAEHDVNPGDKDKGESVLHLALRSRNSTIFKSLLVAGVDTNTGVLDRQHILVVACKHGDPAFVELLLVRGVDVNVSGTKQSHADSIPYDEATPLNAACAEGHLSVVKFLLDHGADIEKSNGSSATPLIAAIRKKSLSAVLLLLDAGADVNHAVDLRHHAVDVTPLSEAAEDCKIEIVEELLSAGATIGSAPTKRNALARACSSGQHMVIELLLNTLSGTQYEAEICGEALSKAIDCGNDKIVRRLLEYGVSPSFKMLRQACSAGALEVVKMLVDKSIDIDEDDGDDAPLLHVAASHLRPDIVQFLINRGTNVMLCSTKYGSPLIAALEGYMAPFLRSYSESESCRSLAEQLPLPEPPYDSNIFRTSSQQVLQCEGIVRSLFSAGTTMDTTIRNFGNALHLASYMGSEEILHQLLKRMEDVNTFGGYFESPLIAAVAGHHLTVVELLLDRNIEINRPSPEHGSALRYACAHSSKQIVQSLLDHGADINAYDDKHGSALAAAVSPTGSIEEQRAIVELLLHHKPRVQIRECDLLAAASGGCRGDGPHYMRLFLQHDPSVVVTEAVIVMAIQEYSDYSVGSRETLRLLLKHDGGHGITPAMLEAAKGNEATDIQLDLGLTLDTTQEDQNRRP